MVPEGLISFGTRSIFYPRRRDVRLIKVGRSTRLTYDFSRGLGREGLVGRDGIEFSSDSFVQGPNEKKNSVTFCVHLITRRTFLSKSH